jgi:LmbE family N-acetylglucosaminyl deacetylase
MADTLTMMAVHAHPDDEASSTGGVLATYADQGIRTVVVTCTNGEFGDAPGGVKPGQDGHDEQAVAQLRLAELRESCAILGVTTWNCSATTTRACRNGTTRTGPTHSATSRRRRWRRGSPA